jgi:lipoic acid synthetase
MRKNQPVCEAVNALKLKAVITSVTRDDLEDGGAGIFAQPSAIRAKSPVCQVEVLIPDFRGLRHLFDRSDSNPDVLNHNLETVPSLYTRWPCRLLSFLQC